jgi:hypothetical protein
MSLFCNKSYELYCLQSTIYIKRALCDIVERQFGAEHFPTAILDKITRVIRPLPSRYCRVAPQWLWCRDGRNSRSRRASRQMLLSRQIVPNHRRQNEVIFPQRKPAYFSPKASEEYWVRALDTPCSTAVWSFPPPRLRREFSQSSVSVSICRQSLVPSLPRSVPSGRCAEARGTGV